MEVLEIRLQTLQDLDGIRHGRLDHIDLLEATSKRAILLKVLAIFLVGRRPHAAQATALKRRLEQVGGIHCAARRRAGPDDSVNLIDEEDAIGACFERFDDLFNALFKVAAIAGAC